MGRIRRTAHSSVTAWLWGLAFVPAAWLLLFGLFILRARMTLGRWPFPYRPDPKDLGFDYHYMMVLAGMPLMFAAALAVTLLTLLAHRRPARQWWIPVVAVLGLVLVILLARADPGLLFTGLAD